MRPSRSWRPRLPIALIAGLAGLAVPAVASAHSLSGRLSSPLPFVAYVAGAGVAVAFSFLLVALSDPGPPKDTATHRTRTVPRVIRLLLRAIGLIGWLWIVAQALIGGASDADVASLFLWRYGWVGLALLSAFIGPVWRWIDPFTTLFDLGAWVLRKLGIRGLRPQPWPERLGVWPAAIGFAFFVWLELVARLDGGRPLGLVLVAYTLITLAGMANYGRDAWRERGETFGVWFGLLNRLARYAAVDGGDDGRVRHRPFGAGLVAGGWSVSLLVVLALGTGSIIYDGISQTEVFFSLFGLPSVPEGTLIMTIFLVAICAAVLWVGRRVGLAAMGAGLLPVAVGYLVAHYLATLLIDGQRIVVAISDPFQQGWDLFGMAFWEPRDDFLPTELMWTIQVGAVVVGHIVGAWAGHAAGAQHRAARGADAREAKRAQWSLAVLMVGLTALTLWSLGQNLKFEGPEPVATGIARALLGG
jgi:hypothetical protein